jgi:hypothetical protein
MGSKSSNKQTTTTKPWEPQGEALQQLFAGAGQLLNQPPQLFDSSRVAGQTPDQTAAQQMLRSNVPQLQQQAQVTNQSNQQLLGASDVGNNPIVADAIQAALNPLARQFTDVVLPSLKLGVNDAGSSSRQGVLEANVTRDFNETSSNLVGRLMGDFYNKGLDAQAKGVALSPNVAGMLNLGPQNLANIGDANQAFQQALLSDEVARFNEAQNAPLTNLINYRNLITGGFGGTTTGPTGFQDPSTIGSILGGGLAGYGATGGPVGAGVGALAAFL